MQQQYVFTNATNIFRNDPDTQNIIVPLIIKQVPNLSEELQIEAGKCFNLLIENRILNLEPHHDALYNLSVQMLK